MSDDLQEEYNNLTKRSINVLNDMGIDTFESLVNNFTNVDGYVNNLPYSKTKHKLQEFLKKISFSLENRNKKTGVFTGKSREKREILQKEKSLGNYELPNLPLIYFYQVLGKKVIKKFYKKDIIFVNDLKKHKSSDNIAYLYWKKLHDVAKIDKSTIKNQEIFESPGLKKLLNFNKISNTKELKPYLISYNKFKRLALSNRNLYEEAKSRNHNLSWSKTMGKYLKSNFQDKIKFLAKMIAPMDRGVFEKRYFFGKTLEEIGEEMDITRERVRQIEKESVSLILPIFNSILTTEIEKHKELNNILQSRPILYPEEKHLFYCLGLEDTNVFKFFELSSYLVFSKTGSKEGIICTKRHSNLQYKKINLFLRDYLLENIQIPEESEIEKIFYLLMAENLILNVNNPTYIKKMLETILNLRFDPVHKEDDIYLNTKRIPNINIIEKILDENGPLHYSKVNEILRKKYKTKLSDKNVHAILTRRGKFVNVGRGIYASLDTNLSGKTIAQLTEDFLKKKNKPQKLKTIKNYVLSKKKVKATSIHATIHSKSNIFGKTKDNKFGLLNWKNIYKFKKSGRSNRYPITIKEAFNQLREDCSLNKPFSINDYIKLTEKKFGNKTSQSFNSIAPFLYDLKKREIITKINSKFTLTDE